MWADDWYGTWGFVASSPNPIRHAVVHKGDDVWKAICSAAGDAELVHLGARLHGWSQGPDMDSRRPCKACVRRLMWVANWWSDQHEQARTDLDDALKPPGELSALRLRSGA